MQAFVKHTNKASIFLFLLFAYRCFDMLPKASRDMHRRDTVVYQGEE